MVLIGISIETWFHRNSGWLRLWIHNMIPVFFPFYYQRTSTFSNTLEQLGYHERTYLLFPWKWMPE